MVSGTRETPAITALIASISRPTSAPDRGPRGHRTRRANGTVIAPDLHKHSVRLAGFEPATPALGVRSRGGRRALTCGNARNECRDCGCFASSTDHSLTTARPRRRRVCQASGPRQGLGIRWHRLPRRWCSPEPLARAGVELARPQAPGPTPGASARFRHSRSHAHNFGPLTWSESAPRLAAALERRWRRGCARRATPAGRRVPHHQRGWRPRRSTGCRRARSRATVQHRVVRASEGHWPRREVPGRSRLVTTR